MSNANSTVSIDEVKELTMPNSKAYTNAGQLAIVQDKPIMMDYWADSLKKEVFIGIKENNEKLLVKSEEEYTSPINKIYKVDNCFLIITENSIYMVNSEISTKRISA